MYNFLTKPSNSNNQNPDSLTHFMLLVSFYTPRKHQKTTGFLIFSGSIERDLLHETD